MFSIALLAIFLIGLAVCAARGELNGFRGKPNSQFPVDGHTSPRDAISAWKANRAIKRAEIASKRELTNHLIAQLEHASPETAHAALLADLGLSQTRVRRFVRAAYRKARRATAEELGVE